MHHRGASGLALLLFLIVALIVALLLTRQMTAVHRVDSETQLLTPVSEQALDAVEGINDRLSQYGGLTGE